MERASSLIVLVVGMLDRVLALVGMGALFQGEAITV
jgi:hypothetical protein